MTSERVKFALFLSEFLTRVSLNEHQGEIGQEHMKLQKLNCKKSILIKLVNLKQSESVLYPKLLVAICSG